MKPALSRMIGFRPNLIGSAVPELLYNTPMSSYPTFARTGEAELVIQKSRFIAFGAEVDSVEVAESHLKAQAEKYPDANHHCYAFQVVGPPQVERYSDDGEPSGTAGKPIYTVLQHHLKNSLIVVTRYFGGTKLGKGGLVKAYTESAKLLLDTLGVIEKEPQVTLTLKYPYALEPILAHFFKQSELPFEPIYGADVSGELAVPISQETTLTEALQNFEIQGLSWALKNT